MGPEHAPNGRDQALEFDRLGIELVAPCGDGLLALALHRMRGHADDWDVPGLRIVLETPHGFQRSLSGISRSIRITSGRSVAANLQPFSLSSAASTSKPPRSSRRVLSMLQVVVVVFDVEHFGHVANSVPLTAALITS